MESSVIREIQRLRQMGVGELRARWREMYGEECRSRNKDYMFRRLCWRTQEIRLGGLSDAAKQRIAALAPAGFVRARVPTEFMPPNDVTAPPPTPARTTRDPRLPSVGTVLTRRYHGREIRVVVTEDGFEWDGRRFDSLSAVARAVTGAKWNGRLFWGVTERKRRK